MVSINGAFRRKLDGPLASKISALIVKERTESVSALAFEMNDVMVIFYPQRSQVLRHT